MFVCVGNTCRSQMAEALARHLASDVIEATSAGLVPLGEIVAPTREVLAEIGVGVDGQSSKPLRPEDLNGADLIVNLTGRSSESVFRGDRNKVEDWKVSDPYGEDLDVYRHIRDEIEGRVRELADGIRTKDEGRRSGNAD